MLLLELYSNNGGSLYTVYIELITVIIVVFKY